MLITFIRHATTAADGRLAGRTDVPLALLDTAEVAALRGCLGGFDRLICSPATRCVDTARALYPATTIVTDERLWEQNFGDWEGRPYTELPDLGPIEAQDLVRHCPPRGESFVDVCQRVAPALADFAQVASHLSPSAKEERIAIVAHAGTVRAALAFALGGRPELAIRFSVATLSATRIRLLPEQQFAIEYVNRTAPPLPQPEM